jgi:hypothetical protein
VPVLLFDELENLEYKFSRGALSPDLLLFAAALLDGDTPVSFVVTGSDQMGTLKGPHWGVLVPKTVPRRIGLLSPSEALRLIEEPVRGHVLYDDGVPASIIRVTAGHPYYTQVICQAIVDYLNLKREFAFGLENLREVLDEVLNNPPPPLNHVWENFTASQKVATSTLAQAIPDETVFLTPDTILEAAPKELRPELPDVSVLRRSLNSLLHDDWVESDGPGYRFRIDLLRLWLLREHSVWQVADELQRSSVP